ncbi:conserved unknown protein [Ectocarpus siliculosus]|uniref:Uncharacterized protein n=1 Tax=Ectocarpus siliculosus TaxID=2880 RepID=D7FPU2_ECTSI|nr:conserved unknown protein [Ectocarpus siliculosus]|eukprot:CBJ30549.1 conserved unknown protein [Ectocarpus siliculosus]
MENPMAPAAEEDEMAEMLKSVKRDGTELSLAYRPFGSVPESLALAEGRYVTSLNLTECDLKSFSNLVCFPSLQTLVLDKNDLEDIKACPTIPTLTTLWFNNNRVADLPAFLDQVLERFPLISDLSMMRNPACPGLMDIKRPDMEACRMYRTYVVFRAPQLVTVDGVDVTEGERRDAALRGQFTVKRRPQEAAAGGAHPMLAEPGGKSSGGIFDRKPKAVLDPLAVRPLVNVASLPSRKPVGVYGRERRYDGAHSEGNRFIVDDHL